MTEKRERRTRPPEFHHNENGTLDEIFADCTNVHVEQMGDEDWWMGVALPGGKLLHVNFWTPRTRIRVNYNEENGPEAGEFWKGEILLPKHKRVKVP